MQRAGSISPSLMVRFLTEKRQLYIWVQIPSVLSGKVFPPPNLLFLTFYLPPESLPAIVINRRSFAVGHGRRVSQRSKQIGFKKVESLQDFNQGAISEQFEKGFAEILANIADPATEACAKRSLQLTVEITTSQDRSTAKTTCRLVTKPAPIKADDGSMLLELTNDGIKAMVKEPERQLELNNVTPMAAGERI